MGGYNEIALEILSTGGYLWEGETVQDAIKRVSSTLASYTEDKDTWEGVFYDCIWNRWICLATPVWTNTGNTPNLPVSCFLTQPQDSVDNIYATAREVALLTKGGGGVGCHFNNIRSRGADISTGGKSEGIVPWMKSYGSVYQAVSQGSTRRGAGAVYFDIESDDFYEALRFRRHDDSLHLGVNVTDAFIEKCKNGDKEARKRWELLLKERAEVGEPYIFFIDRANRARPECYGDKKLNGSNICSEITTLTNEHFTGTCVLSSLNLAKFDEWEDEKINGHSIPAIAIKLLDCVNKHFIEKAKDVPGLEKAVRYASIYKSLGLGVIGWHSYLQQRMIPWDSYDAMMHNNKVFRFIKQEAETMRDGHAHLLAIAPTRTNALIANQVSQGIQPVIANIYVDKAAKAQFVWKNKALEKHIPEDKKDEVWAAIENNGGSVQGLDQYFSSDVQEVFKTFGEINQVAILRQAEQRQKYICQAQSLNLMFSKHDTEKTIHDVHWYAATECKNLKSIYYMKSEAAVKAGTSNVEECLGCGG